MILKDRKGIKDFSLPNVVMFSYLLVQDVQVDSLIPMKVRLKDNNFQVCRNCVKSIKDFFF